MTESDDGNERDDDSGEEGDLDLDRLFEAIPQERSGAEPAAESETGSESADTAFEGVPDEIDGGRFSDLLERTGGRTAPADIEDLEDRMAASRERQRPAENAEASRPAPDPTEHADQTGDIDEAAVASIRDELVAPSNHLFIGPNGGSDVEDCLPLFSLYPPEEQNVLLVSMRQASEGRLDHFYQNARAPPANVAVLTSSDTVRSTTTAPGMEVENGGSNISIKTIDDPGDLTRLGITLSGILEPWKGDDRETLVCFDSISSILQYSSLQRVFRFLHVLQGRLADVDAITHFHLDPDAHSSEAVATLQSLMDGVIRVTPDGEFEYE